MCSKFLHRAIHNPPVITIIVCNSTLIISIIPAIHPNPRLPQSVLYYIMCLHIHAVCPLRGPHQPPPPHRQPAHKKTHLFAVYSRVALKKITPFFSKVRARARHVWGLCQKCKPPTGRCRWCRARSAASEKMRAPLAVKQDGRSRHRCERSSAIFSFLCAIFHFGINFVVFFLIIIFNGSRQHFYFSVLLCCVGF